MARRKRGKLLDDFMKWKIEILAKHGGFSHKCIASIVFGRPVNRVTKRQLSSVSSYLGYHKIRVTDWRAGRTVQAQTFANKVVTLQKASRKTKRKAA